jgi:peptide deformylase
MGKPRRERKGGLPGAAAIAPETPRDYLSAMAAETLHDADDRLRILIAPDPVLRRHARAVAEGDGDAVRALIPRMFATMYAAPGIGLAAPQVGVSLRLAVIDLQRDDRPAPLVLINPEIVAATAETEVHEEGCLSLPGQYADVTRPRAITVRFIDEAGARQQVVADGLLGRCIQHEIDHLDGRLFVDHLSALKRSMILRRLAKAQRAKEG